MSRSKLLFTIAAFWLSFGQASAETANDPTGIWLTQAGDAKIRVNHCASGLCGTIVWLKVPIDPATGKPQVDDKNNNPSLAKRPIIGLNIFNRMTAASIRTTTPESNEHPAAAKLSLRDEIRGLSSPYAEQTRFRPSCFA